jgi:hypothetical protein
LGVCLGNLLEQVLLEIEGRTIGSDGQEHARSVHRFSRAMNGGVKPLGRQRSALFRPTSQRVESELTELSERWFVGRRTIEQDGKKSLPVNTKTGVRIIVDLFDRR